MKAKDNKLLWIDTKYEVLLISRNKNQYTVCSEHDIVGSILRIENPIIFNLDSPNVHFEAGVFHGAKVNIEKCRVTATETMDFFMKISSNKILFVTINETMAKITCNGREAEVILRKSGLLTLNPNCQLKTEFIEWSIAKNDKSVDELALKNITQPGVPIYFSEINQNKFQFSESNSLIDTRDIRAAIA